MGESDGKEECTMAKGRKQWIHIYIYMIKNRKKIKVKLRDIIKNRKNIQIGKQKNKPKSRIIKNKNIKYKIKPKNSPKKVPSFDALL